VRRVVGDFGAEHVVALRKPKTKMFQIRNPKHEIRNKSECPMTEIQNATHHRGKPCTAATGVAAKYRLDRQVASRRTADRTAACHAANPGIAVLIIRLWGFEFVSSFGFL